MVMVSIHASSVKNVRYSVWQATCLSVGHHCVSLETGRRFEPQMKFDY